MARKYRHIKIYENEILELTEKGMSQRQIADKLGFTYKKCIFFKRYNRNQRKLAAGIVIMPSGDRENMGQNFRRQCQVKVILMTMLWLEFFLNSQN